MKTTAGIRHRREEGYTDRFSGMGKLAVLLLVLGIVLGLMRPASADTDTTSHGVKMRVQDIASVVLDDGLNVRAQRKNINNSQHDIDARRMLHYISVTASGSTRSVTAQWAVDDTAPAGISLKLEASVPPGCGVPAGRVALSDAAHDIVTNIGTCTTERGANGAELTYTLSIDDATELVAADGNTATITFTLNEDS